MKHPESVCRAVSLLLAVCCMPPVLCTAAAETTEPIYALRSHLLTCTTLSAPGAADADADGNGILSAADLTLLKRQYFAAHPPKYAGICINEICTSNHGSYRDAEGGSPDWIELYNGSSMLLDLKGCGLSDKSTDRYRYVFPGASLLPPGGCLLICCDGAEIPFKLSASGETVYLTAPRNPDGSDGAALDTVRVPALDPDITYARVPDGGAWVQCEATPHSSNNNAVQIHKVGVPVFSKAAGFYDDPFSLTLTAAEGCRVYYTTDGSDPRDSETAEVYQKALQIRDNTGDPNRLSACGGISSVSDFVPDHNVEKGMIIRAVCKDSEGYCSNVVTNGYYIGKTAPYYQSLRVISVTTGYENLFSSETGIYLQKNCMNKGREWERPAHIQIYEQGTAVYSEDVGVRIAGNWSRNYPQKSLTFYARSEYGASGMKYDFFSGGARDCAGKAIREFDKVTLRNGGDGYDAVRFRDDLNAYLASGLQIGTQAKYDYVVFLDGEFWGCYSMQEKLGDDYLEAHYHIPKENITTIKNTLGEGDAAVYQSYFDFYEWAKGADFTDPENYRRFCETIDVRSMIDWIAAESIVCNWDSLVNVNNTMIWRANQTDDDNPYADGRWRFLYFDTEYSSGFSGTGADYNDLAKMDRSGAPNSFGTLFYRLIRNPDFAALFRDAYENALDTHFTAERASAQIDRYTERLTDVYLATAKRFGIDMDPEKLERLTGEVRAFWDQRGAFARRNLSACLTDE